MKVQLVTPYHVSHLQGYGVTVRGNVISLEIYCLNNPRNTHKSRETLDGQSAELPTRQSSHS